MTFNNNNKKLNIFLLFSLFLFAVYACTKDEIEQPYEHFPSKLSNTGIFTGQISDLIPTDGYTFYELSSVLFSDYAEKQRLIKLPTGEQLTKIDEGIPHFPNGTSLVKTFYYWKDKKTPSKGKRIIETRLLVKENEDWIVGVYKWNTQQTEAYLLSSGNDEAVNWINEKGEGMVTTYHIPSTKECITCHQSNGVFKPIGLKLFNLNRPIERNSNTINQLEYFQQLGLLNNFDVNPIDKLPDYKDESYSLAERARAYMEINCSHCHNPGGFAPSWIDLDFRNYTPHEDTGIDADKSLIIEKIKSGTMPFIGTSILDQEGVDLLIEYLNSL